MTASRTVHVFDQLPGFEGEKPVGTELTLSGAVGRRTRAMKIGESLVLVVEVQVTGVNHKETKGGILRAHALKVIDAYELGDSRAPDLLEELHQEYEQAADAAKARAAIDFENPDPYGTDPAAAAAGAGPEARADARAERTADQEWDGFGGSDLSEADKVALQELSDAADLAAIEASTGGGTMTRDEFLAAVEQYAHDAELIEVPLGDLDPPAVVPDGSEAEPVDGGTVTPIGSKKAPAKKAPAKKAAAARAITEAAKKAITPPKA